ncbi:hypothetical protein CcaverHIS002_0602340 [Cutaneotrichosporon cavernicola]|uniref:Uncharacterized protein n=1 Tax=Cutaneotrichosporon cavernicola TaxID=279322 RepID=A0AA48L828_9TREE|nr:uncharacterized protein CcaverHIS019_0601830 [Cutaneotrichosporon cavernicola]BEI85947.1 hypothetical protein CcaverHIS002_0602340 [Cutaneotrichosporon cavernicola]BEI93724.1 hypothetical protein CcaverHIS019_0601830 [Cutaneotrichosporon cavernicola]
MSLVKAHAILRGLAATFALGALGGAAYATFLRRETYRWNLPAPLYTHVVGMAYGSVAALTGFILLLLDYRHHAPRALYEMIISAVLAASGVAAGVLLNLGATGLDWTSRTSDQDKDMRASLLSAGTLSLASSACFFAAAMVAFTGTMMAGGGASKYPIRPMRAIPITDFEDMIAESESIWRVPSRGREDVAGTPFPDHPPKYAEAEFPRPLALVERAKHQRTLSHLSVSEKR